jgi:acid phosphatase
MTNDGHDTSVTFAAQWLKSFLDPLLTNKNFMDNALIHITFDENEDYPVRNGVFNLLLGDVIPKELIGTVDSNYYNHYSELSTVAANWGLYTLGRWDVGANVFAYVAAHTGDNVRKWNNDDYPAFDKMYFNSSYPGILNSKKWAPQPVPDIRSRRNGRSTVPAIQETWKGTDDLDYYHGELEIPGGDDYPPVNPYKWQISK